MAQSCREAMAARVGLSHLQDNSEDLQWASAPFGVCLWFRRVLADECRGSLNFWGIHSLKSSWQKLEGNRVKEHLRPIGLGVLAKNEHDRGPEDPRPISLA